MKKFIVILLAIFMFFTLFQGIFRESIVDASKTYRIEASAEKESSQTVIVLQIGKTSFTINGVAKALDSPSIIENGRTLLPIRAVIEALGGTVGWDATEKKVTVTLGSTTIELWISKNTARVNGITKPIDSSNPKVVPEIINGRTMLPLRFVAENLGCDVNWNGTTNTITITYPKSSPAKIPDGDNLLLGNPSNAVHSTSSPDNYLMDQKYYVISYNRDRGEPNWVSWYLGSSTLGSVDRSNDFRADPSLPTDWYHVQAKSYSYSGFDRGHNCPSGDRTSSYEANSSTFLMTNMIPQAPNNNRVTWENFENYLRSLVQEGYEVYIVMGSYGTGGTGSNGYKTTIDNGHVTVPAYIWKVAVVLPDGDNDLNRINTNTRVIAIDTPNTNSVNSDWRKYLVSVDDIEKATGYDLLSNVPESIQKVIEAKVDSGN